MKIISLKKLLFAASLCLFTGAFLFAQEKDNKEVRIMVKKNDSTTVDTSFTLDEDMDKDEIQEMIHELTGTDVKVHHGDKMDNVYAFSIKDSADFDTDIDVDMKKMEIKVIVDDDGESHTVIKKYSNGDHKKWVDHKSGTHYVIVEDEDGEMKKSEMVFISKKHEGDENKVMKKIVHKDGNLIMITEEDVHKDDKGNFSIMKKETDDKNIIVLESSEKPIHFVTKDGKELKIIVKDEKSGTDIVLDKVKVIVIETTEDGVINVVVSDKKTKEEKMEKEEKNKKVIKKK